MRNPFRPRTTGEPASSNGASSLHLAWDVPVGGPIVAAAATLEVVEAPVVDRLYFWALQVSFRDRDGRRSGGGHLGLQHHPAYPGGGAVNWGGYDPAGRVLDGTDSPLPGTLGNPNTRDLPWRPYRPYRLRIHHLPGSDLWAGDVIDLETGTPTRVRELVAGGDLVDTPLVWSEVFARCDHPSVAVRWSDLVVETVAGDTVPVRRVRTSYQSRADGGCDNTDSGVVDGAFVQRTATPRSNRHGAVLDRG
jgi:hypothetical protein